MQNFCVLLAFLKSTILKIKNFLKSTILKKKNFLKSTILKKKFFLKSMILKEKVFVKSMILNKKLFVNSMILNEKTFVMSDFVSTLSQRVTFGIKNITTRQVLKRKSLPKSTTCTFHIVFLHITMYSYRPQYPRQLDNSNRLR